MFFIMITLLIKKTPFLTEHWAFITCLRYCPLHVTDVWDEVCWWTFPNNKNFFDYREGESLGSRKSRQYMEGLNSTLMTSSEWKEKYFNLSAQFNKAETALHSRHVAHVDTCDGWYGCVLAHGGGHTTKLLGHLSSLLAIVVILIFIIAHVYVMFAFRVDKC